MAAGSGLIFSCAKHQNHNVLITMKYCFKKMVEKRLRNSYHSVVSRPTMIVCWVDFTTCWVSRTAEMPAVSTVSKRNWTATRECYCFNDYWFYSFIVIWLRLDFGQLQASEMGFLLVCWAYFHIKVAEQKLQTKYHVISGTLQRQLNQIKNSDWFKVSI